MLEVRGLSTYFYSEDGVVKAVDDVSFSVGEGEVLGIVGESGSGKSTVAHSIMRLVPPPGKIVAGQMILDGKDLMTLSEEEMIKIRGAKISMVFQDPFTSLNPVFAVGGQIAEAVELHQGLGRKKAWEKAVEMLDLVQIKNPAQRAKDYPHQFSGGMRQRVMIAMALACHPELLIADEPTTALDVTIQAEILRLLKEIQGKLNISIVYITHNFGIIKSVCRKVAVMHKGRVVEEGPVSEILAGPRSPYTQKLLEDLKVLNQDRGR